MDVKKYLNGLRFPPAHCSSFFDDDDTFFHSVTPIHHHDRNNPFLHDIKNSQCTTTENENRERASYLGVLCLPLHRTMNKLKGNM